MDEPTLAEAICRKIMAGDWYVDPEAGTIDTSGSYTGLTLTPDEVGYLESLRPVRFICVNLLTEAPDPALGVHPIDTSQGRTNGKTWGDHRTEGP